MIGSLTGTLLQAIDNTVILNVNGVGYEVFVPKNYLKTLTLKQTNLTLHIHTHVSESAIHLHGFTTANEKNIFQKLITVSGIGPRLALNILSDLSVAQLIGAICQSETAVLTSVSGVGKKTAQRIIMELKDKFKDMALIAKAGAANDNPLQDPRLGDVAKALLSLGYADSQVGKIIRQLKVEPQDTIQTLVKKSLGTAESH